jgi:hypothetical protein
MKQLSALSSPHFVTMKYMPRISPDIYLLPSINDTTNAGKKQQLNHPFAPNQATHGGFSGGRWGRGLFCVAGAIFEEFAMAFPSNSMRSLRAIFL